MRHLFFTTLFQHRHLSFYIHVRESRNLKSLNNAAIHNHSLIASIAARLKVMIMANMPLMSMHASAEAKSNKLSLPFYLPISSSYRY